MLSPTNGTDSDEDTLTDWDEADNRYITVNADGSVSLPTIQRLLSHIDIQGILDYAGTAGAGRNVMFNAICNWEVLPCKSDPTLKDTDGDNLNDDSDAIPLEVFDQRFMLLENFDYIPTIDFVERHIELGEQCAYSIFPHLLDVANFTLFSTLCDLGISTPALAVWLNLTVVTW